LAETRSDLGDPSESLPLCRGTLTGVTSAGMLAGMIAFAVTLTFASSALFRFGLRHYKSASS